MIRYTFILLAVLLFTGCKKDGEQQDTTNMPKQPTALSLQPKKYEAKTSLPCKADNCTYVNIDIMEAKGGNKVVADSINKKIFNAVRSIVYFGEKPTNATSYDEITSSFIKSYDELAGKFPDEAIPWEAKIKVTREYTSPDLLNMRVNNYMYTGGAHGYEGNMSLLFDAKTGKSLTKSDIFKDVPGLTAYAEKKFREKHKIPANKPINSTGLTFENEQFILPQNIFFKQDGVLLLYNPYEITSFADGAKEVLLPYSELEPYLKVK